MKDVLKLDALPEGWRKIGGAVTAPDGYYWASNGKSRFFSKEFQHALIKEEEHGNDQLRDR